MNTTKIRIIFFATALTYNLILGFYLRDFIVLSPTLLVFYLLSVLPTLFLSVEIKSKAMRTVIVVLLVLIACMNFAYAVYCRRVFPFLALVPLAIVLLNFIAFANNTGKEKLLTKIYVLVVSAVIVTTLFSSYIFVYKQDDISLTNGQATLWDTKTVQLADEICADCDTDTEKVKAIYNWMIHNLEYDYGYTPLIQYFNVRKTLNIQKGICYDFAHLFAALCRSQNISCYVVDGMPFDSSKDNHTWNRVYFDGSWWNLDVTFDTIQTKNQGQLYSFRKIETAFSSNDEYWIKKMY